MKIYEAKASSLMMRIEVCITLLQLPSVFNQVNNSHSTSDLKLHIMQCFLKELPTSWLKCNNVHATMEKNKTTGEKRVKCDKNRVRRRNDRALGNVTLTFISCFFFFFFFAVISTKVVNGQITAGPVMVY